MSQQILNVGSGSNTGDGDTLRVAGIKINENFTELYNTSANTTANKVSISIVSGLSANNVQAAIEELDLNKLPVANTILNVYTETGANLTISANTITIPLNGKIYSVVVDSVIDTINTTTPITPNCGSAVIYFTQNTTGYAVTYPNTWYWSSGISTSINSTANAISRLVLYTDPIGRIHADADIRSISA